MSDRWFSFAEQYGLQCVPLKRPGDGRLLSRPVNSEKTVPFCLQLKALEGIVLPKYVSGETVQLKVNATLYHSKSRQFFGRTWSSHLLLRKATANRKDSININQNVYFHSSNTDPSTMIVLELVAIHGTVKELSCGWTYLAPFGNVNLLKDTTAKASSQTARLDVYQGSPRLLFYVDNVPSETGSLTALPGCHIHYFLMTHSPIQLALHLLPENVFVGAQDDIPGIFNKTEGGMSISPLDLLWKPKLARRSPSLIDKLSLVLHPSLDHFERQLLVLFTRDRKAKDSVIEDIHMNIAERRLLVGIHNGWTFVKRPYIAYLDITTKEKPTTPSRSQKHRQSQRASTWEDNAVVKELALPTVIQLTDVVAHSLYTLVFMLEYVISWPLTQHDKLNPGITSMTKSQSQSVVACWAAWTPAEATSAYHHVELSLCGGAAPNPGHTFIFVGCDVTENQLGDGDCGTVSFKYAVQDEKQRSENVSHVRRPSAAMSDIGSELHTWQHSEADIFHDAQETIVTHVETTARPPLPRQPATPGHSGIVEHDTPKHRPLASVVTPTPLAMQELLNRPATSTPADELEGQQGELSLLPYTPVVGVAPLSSGQVSAQQQLFNFPPLTTARGPTTLPAAMHYSSAHSHIPRSAYAQLHTAGFPEVKDSKGRTPVEVDSQQTVSYNPDRELRQPLQCNNITIQFLAISNIPSMQESSVNSAEGSQIISPLYRVVFFTFQFYRFPAVTTERLLLSGLNSDSQLNVTSIHILTKLSRIDSVCGYQMEFVVDPSDFEADESRRLARYLHTRSLQVDVWDGESLLHVGSAFIPLMHLIREGREAVQVTHEVPVTYVEYSDDMPTLLGDFARSGSVRPPRANAEIRGSLHIRLFNVGSKSKLEHTGPVSSVVQGNSGIFSSDGNVVSLADGRLPSTSGESHRVKAKLLVDSDKDLAAVLKSRKVGVTRPVQSVTANGEDTVTKQRKHARMAMVRRLVGEENYVSGMSNTASLTNQRAQELRTIAAFRERHKQERILSALCHSITTAHTIRPSYGVASFFEFILKNPYNSSLTVKIEWNRAELQLLTDTKEWQHFKQLYNVATPLEEGMFSDASQNDRPQLYLKPNETVYIPFKYQSFYQQSQSTNETAQFGKWSLQSAFYQQLQSTTIKVSFIKCDDSHLVSILNLCVEPQPYCIDQTFRFQHPEQAFFKKSIILPPFHSLRDQTWLNENHSSLSLHCSNSNVVCEIRDGEGREPSQVYLKVACEAAPSVVQFCLLLYKDLYRSQPAQIWQFSIHSVQRIDVSAVQGQKSEVTVILRGLSLPKTVRCFSSCPEQLVVNPKVPFQLSANAAHEIHMSLKLMEAGTKSVFVNVVDVEFYQLVRSWLLCATCRPPVITKAFEQLLSVRTGKLAYKKISYHNPYSVSKRFHLYSTSFDLLQFRENVIEIPAGQTYPIGLKFLPQMIPISREVLIFINNESDKTEECFCVKVMYS